MKMNKNVSIRERLSVTTRTVTKFLFHSTFFNIYNYGCYGAYYAKVLRNIEKFLSVCGISVQPKERDPTRTANEMRSEQIISCDTKTPGGITRFSTKQTSIHKWCINRYSIRKNHVTFQGMIIKEINLAETISEQTISCDAKTPGGITSFSTKQ